MQHNRLHNLNNNFKHSKIAIKIINNRLKIKMFNFRILHNSNYKSIVRFSSINPHRIIINKPMKIKIKWQMIMFNLSSRLTQKTIWFITSLNNNTINSNMKSKQVKIIQRSLKLGMFRRQIRLINNSNSREISNHSIYRIKFYFNNNPILLCKCKIIKFCIKIGYAQLPLLLRSTVIYKYRTLKITFYLNIVYNLFTKK